MKSDFIKLAFSATFVAFLAACSPTAQSSLLTDQASDPTGHSMSTDPSATELYLRADTSNLGTVTSARVVELSGDCFASTYPTHRLMVTVNGVTKSIYNIDSTKSAASCKNGRFDVALTGAQLSTGTNNIVLTMTAYDANSSPYTNGNGMTTFTVIRSD